MLAEKYNDILYEIECGVYRAYIKGTKERVPSSYEDFLVTEGYLKVGECFLLKLTIKGIFYMFLYRRGLL